MPANNNLQWQLGCLRHAVAGAQLEPQVREGAEAGIRALEWVERNQKALRELNLTLDLLTSFPGAELTVTRHDQ